MWYSSQLHTHISNSLELLGLLKVHLCLLELCLGFAELCLLQRLCGVVKWFTKCSIILKTCTTQSAWHYIWTSFASDNHKHMVILAHLWKIRVDKVCLYSQCVQYPWQFSTLGCSGRKKSHTWSGGRSINEYKSSMFTNCTYLFAAVTMYKKSVLIPWFLNFITVAYPRTWIEL